ncbi:MAG: hypothetical protein NTW03_10455, partial [Verrucomicrobia bacterium]|nr:hypothetical protein [Verrucomicrobiota bacterium]
VAIVCPGNIFPKDQRNYDMKINCQPEFVIISALLLRGGDTLAPRGTSGEEGRGEGFSLW